MPNISDMITNIGRKAKVIGIPEPNKPEAELYPLTSQLPTKRLDSNPGPLGSVWLVNEGSWVRIVLRLPRFGCVFRRRHCMSSRDVFLFSKTNVSLQEYHAIWYGVTRTFRLRCLPYMWAYGTYYQRRVSRPWKRDIKKLANVAILLGAWWMADYGTLHVCPVPYSQQCIKFWWWPSDPIKLNLTIIELDIRLAACVAVCVSHVLDRQLLNGWCHRHQNRLCSRLHSNESVIFFSNFWDSYFSGYGEFVEFSLRFTAAVSAVAVGQHIILK